MGPPGGGDRGREPGRTGQASCVRRRRVLVVGLDCLEPSLAFDRFRAEMPNLQRIAGGAWGELESVCPPITCPAWMCAFTGRDPGQLGVYGFRNRADWGYGPLQLAFSDSIPAERAPAVWDVASAAGRHCTVIGVPPGYPPRVVRGEFVGCFLTPGPDSPFAYPPALIAETRSVVGTYRFDVEDARSEDREQVLAEIYDMTAKRWKLAEHLLRTRDWDLFAMVEIGTDRMHHAFWQFMDPEHVLHVPDSPYRDAIRAYYRYVDGLLGRLLALADDETLVLCVSDHGARRMDGGFHLNEWLLREGYLALREGPARPGRLRPEQVDWSRTVAWGDGGYYGRIFFNVQGREPQGVVAPERYPALRQEVAAALERLPLPWGQPAAPNRVFFPERVYLQVHGFAPDLILYPGDLSWRALASFPATAGQVFTRENDTGPDGANHARYGVFTATTGRALHRGEGPRRRVRGLRLVDLAPTILGHLGLPVPDGIAGQAIDPRVWGEEGR
jgi:predicted AlkP superfamily phosphohydrolase/phosphomutase